MNAETQQLMQEHSQLIVRINELDNELYGNGGFNTMTDITNNQTQDDIFCNMTEFGNKGIQLASMRTYLKALECRLNNRNIFFENGEYFERVAVIDKTSVKPQSHNSGQPVVDNGSKC